VGPLQPDNEGDFWRTSAGYPATKAASNMKQTAVTATAFILRNDLAGVRTAAA